ncbi:MAG: hypothetical protein ACK5D8_05440 [Bacteroidota bacterium]
MWYICKDMQADRFQLFPGFPPESRMWIFQADRKLTDADKNYLSQTFDRFFPTWTSHEKPMKAAHALLKDFFLVIALDQTQAGASGCGIDKLMHVVRSAGEALQINFFDRNKVLALVDGIPHLCAVNEADKWIRKETPVYVIHHLQTLGELSSICIPAKDSWLANRITLV